MKRYILYFSGVAALFAIWGGMLVLLEQGVLDARYRFPIQLLPLLGLVCFGCFCAGKLIFDLLTFKNYPHEIAALEKDIAEAKQDLKNRGFKDK